MPKKEFGERLFALRKAKNISQAEVAEYIGLTIAAYQNYENGRREAGYDIIAKLATFYGVSTDYLLGMPGAKPPESPIEAMEREKKLKSLEKRLIKEYLELPEKQREAVIAFMDKIIAEEAAERGFVLQSDGTYVKAPGTDVTAKISALEKQNQDLLTRIEAIEKEDMETEYEKAN